MCGRNVNVADALRELTYRDAYNLNIRPKIRDYPRELRSEA